MGWGGKYKPRGGVGRVGRVGRCISQWVGGGRRGRGGGVWEVGISLVELKNTTFQFHVFDRY